MQIKASVLSLSYKLSKKKKKKRESNVQKWTYGGCKNYSRHLRASTLKNDTLSYFIILKNYFINYTIPFYNTPYIQKLYYFTFSLKYYFFNIYLLFLSHYHFFSAKGWNKIYIYIYFSIVLQYNSKFRIVL